MGTARFPAKRGNQRFQSGRGLVAQRHRISESLLYNWRAAWKAAAAGSSAAVAFVPLGVVGEADSAAPALLAPPEPPSSPRREARAGAIEIALPDGSRVSVDAFVNEKALSRVLRAMRGAA
jgi:transposase